MVWTKIDMMWSKRTEWLKNKGERERKKEWCVLVCEQVSDVWGCEKQERER